MEADRYRRPGRRITKLVVAPCGINNSELTCFYQVLEKSS